ncbi:BURP domain-containing protein 4-like [Triticum aestivum]|uniref:BURP domain-containing protein 4-like n=1 Tax=Triticum aestivum TaxID=4565 RepID=UPI001D032D99|nr:BURP domain-containing protein 4-like [Triticum aestivum]
MAIKLIAVVFFFLVPAFAESSDREENGFGESAYAVHWDPPQEKGFGASAYKVDWNPPSKEKGFGASAYKVDWNPPSKEGFGASAYKVDWNPPSKEKGFGASAYKVDWNPEDTHSKEKGFEASAYKVSWSPDGAPSASYIPEAPTKHKHIKVQTGMLFLEKNLHIGTTLPKGTMFARDGAPKSVHFASTPLESKYLTTILSHFMIPHGSTKAKQVADPLRSCGKPVDKEEPHMCFSSREAMSRFATRELGVSGARAAITSERSIHGNETPNSMYVVEQITQLNNNVVPCHPMNFPYEVFYCHRSKEVQSLRVQLKGLKDGMPHVTAIAMCHMNTSNWDTQYFELLDGKRGERICHYMPTNYIMFY